MTISDLMEDRVTLDGVLLKCNQNPAKARHDVECENARIAIERLAQEPDPAVEKKREEEFERAREQRRIAQERLRQEQEAKTKAVDAYSLPVVPVDPAPPQKGTAPAGGTADAPSSTATGEPRAKTQVNAAPLAGNSTP